jgi:protoheme IX farnesyltransferase
MPNTHGAAFTRLHVLLYTILLIAVTLLPFATYMCGPIYLAGAMALNAVFLYYAVRMQFDDSDALAYATFKYSIVYLTLLFVVLFIDHYWPLAHAAFFAPAP